MTEQPPTLPEAAAQLQTAMRAYFAAIAPHVAAMARAIATAAEHIGAVEQHRDRPAWQSPYGPPARRQH
ncbi:hypothetical protein ACH4GE_18915 [Streptomyces tendae]|uniref:hypothetical protein n=1 Tax=Streptomyces TaxID=1883 RepID=UPI00379E5CC0